MDVVPGVTRTINPGTAAQFNLFQSSSEGYHTDPYKVVSIANADDIELRRIYESRPTERERRGFFTSWVHERPAGETIAFDYRYYTDDWGIVSHTFNLRFRSGYLEPFGRLYMQSEADSHVRNPEIGERVPWFVSVDNRLAELQSLTLGVRWGIPLGTNGTPKLRAFRFEHSMEDAVFDDNTANVVQLAYSKDFF